jgi:hypothetical protein
MSQSPSEEHVSLRTWIAVMSAVESKPASDGRIKTSHFFRLNRGEMFWQEVI